MKPTSFKYQNRTLLPSNAEYSANVSGVDPLPIWTDGEQCVSCWRMSWRERLSALLFGRVWLAVLSHNTQPPVFLWVGREYLRESDR